MLELPRFSPQTKTRLEMGLPDDESRCGATCVCATPPGNCLHAIGPAGRRSLTNVRFHKPTTGRESRKTEPQWCGMLAHYPCVTEVEDTHSTAISPLPVLTPPLCWGSVFTELRRGPTMNVSADSLVDAKVVSGMRQPPTTNWAKVLSGMMQPPTEPMDWWKGPSPPGAMWMEPTALVKYRCPGRSSSGLVLCPFRGMSRSISYQPGPGPCPMNEAREQSALPRNPNQTVGGAALRRASLHLSVSRGWCRISV